MLQCLVDPEDLSMSAQMFSIALRHLNNALFLYNLRISTINVALTG